MGLVTSIATPPAPKTTLFHLVGGICVAAASGAALVAVTLASFGMSYCGEAPPPSNKPTLQLALAVIGGLWSALPLAVAAAARVRRREPRAWLIIGGLAVALTVYATLTAEPSYWCLF